MKRIVSRTIETLLLIYTLPFAFNIQQVDADTTTVKILPEVVKLAPEYVVGRNFTVAVVIVNVKDLVGFDLKFCWNTTYLDYVDHTATIPVEDYPSPIPASPYAGILHAPKLEVKNEVNTTAGTYWAVFSTLGGPSFNGSGTVSTMTFMIRNQSSAVDVEVSLHFTVHELAGIYVIPHIVEDGLIKIPRVPPLSASITPLSPSINLGDSVTFTSTVTRGTPPYSYQWYLNGDPVSGATSSNWIFTPSASGIYHVYLEVADAEGNTAQSETSRITVDGPIPIGGHSLAIKQYISTKPQTLYLAVAAILTLSFIMIKREKHKGLARCTHNIAFILMLLLFLMRLNIPFGRSGETDILVTDFYSCDRVGNSQDYFPIKTMVYFNLSLRNLAHDPKNVSISLSVQDETNVPIGLDQFDITIPPDVSTYCIISIFIPKWARVGVATAYGYVLVEGIVIYSETEFYIGPEDLTPPMVHLLSPENVTYSRAYVSLLFTVNERTSWIGYTLSNLENQSIARNSTLTDLANGSYSIRVYANDTSGNMGSSAEVYFTISVVHDVAVIDLKCSFTHVYLGQIVNIHVSVQNDGTANESFNVATYANTTAIETLTVNNLFPSNQTTLTFTWNTTGWAKGDYTLSAYVQPVQGETDTEDNALAGSSIVVTIPGDVDGDFDVDIYDIVKLSTSCGYGKDDPEYSANCDINCDGKIDIYDIVIMCTHYGETCP